VRILIVHPNQNRFVHRNRLHMVVSVLSTPVPFVIVHHFILESIPKANGGVERCVLLE
jgi:hypothetical protein